ncbi:hypothetical protein JOQ06_024816 [Pogonophryne albipinna]|uniref:Uncharacterized protein n=1 Tax=Pogonophryne albipinna TaxID=1090488 RepID=A0AAD6ATA0_9TELE|nr:hypothetical protein JOQ06_024816 [Pogonophryne albipinna]
MGRGDEEWGGAEKGTEDGEKQSDGRQVEKRREGLMEEWRDEDGKEEKIREVEPWWRGNRLSCSPEGLLRNGDEDTDKDNERKEDFKNESQRIKDEDREEKMRIVETAVMREKCNGRDK